MLEHKHVIRTLSLIFLYQQRNSAKKSNCAEQVRNEITSFDQILGGIVLRYRGKSWHDGFR